MNDPKPSRHQRAWQLFLDGFAWVFAGLLIGTWITWMLGGF